MQDVFSESLDAFYCSFVLSINKSERNSYGIQALYSYASYLLCVSNPFKELEVEILPNKMIVLKPDEGNYDAFIESRWFDAILLSIIFRDTRNERKLKSIDLSVIRPYPSETLNSLMYLHLNNLLYYWKDVNQSKDSYNWLIQEVSVNYDNYTFKDDRTLSYFRLLCRNFILGLKALRDEDDREFNIRLEKCVQDHHEFYKQKRGLNRGHGPIHDLSEGMICLTGLALASMGYDKGFSVKCESDYLPRDIIEKDF